MKKFHDVCKKVGEGPLKLVRLKRSRLFGALAAATLAACFVAPSLVHAQVLPDAEAGGFKISAGGTASGYYLQYGQRKLGGLSAFVDAETHRRLGIEAEGRWLELNQVQKVHVETYSVGLRYHMNFGRFQPYAKGLIGFGDFNFPFNFAHGRYLVVTGGGGLEYRLTPRIRLRVPDVEYQDWPQFTYGAMSSVGVSAGVKVGIF
jgi:opacity protein-like surface antigen